MRDAVVFAAFVLLLCFNGWGCSSAMTHVDEWCAEHACDTEPLAFTTDGAHTELLTHVLDNINAASGLSLHVSDRGAPVAFAPVALSKEGEPVCGTTHVAWAAGETLSVELVIATEWVPGCVPQWAVLRHEIACHALRNEQDAEHTESGICSSESVAGPAFDQLSLDAMCSAMGC